MERKQLRDYLHHAFVNLANNLQDLIDDFPDEENDCDNDNVVDALDEMHDSLMELASKTARDIRLRDTKTCQECFNDFNLSRFSSDVRFCSDVCEGKYDRGVAGESNEDFDE